jgi:hypothetical protein
MDAKRQLTSSALALLLAAVILTGCTPAGTTSAQNSPTSTTTAQATVTPTSTPTSAVHGDWQTYTDVTFGFRLDVPAILALYHPKDTGGYYTLAWAYNQTQGSPPSGQALFAEVEIYVNVADSFINGAPNPCTEGTPTTIGSGITGYEEDSLDAPPPPPGAGHGEGGFDVNLATGGGVYFHIYLIGTAPKESFRARYSAIWKHILNSFVPGPAVPNTHPCG